MPTARLAKAAFSVEARDRFDVTSFGDASKTWVIPRRPLARWPFGLVVTDGPNTVMVIRDETDLDEFTDTFLGLALSGSFADGNLHHFGSHDIWREIDGK